MGTFNVRTLAVNGKNGLGHVEEIMEVCRQSRCNILGLQETRQDGFAAAGFTVYCSGAGGGVTQAKGPHGVGLAIKDSIFQNAEKDGLLWSTSVLDFMKVRLNLTGKSNDLFCDCVRSD